MDEKIKKSMSMNQMVVGNQRAAAQLFRSKIPTVSNIIVMGSVQNIKCLEPLPVFLDGEEIKAETDLVYMHKDETLVVRVQFSDDIKLDDQTVYYVKPNVRPVRIGCPTCQNYYSNGQSACECIRQAPHIYVDEILIESIDVMNGDTVLDKLDDRQKLLIDFFGGAISKLTILELI